MYSGMSSLILYLRTGFLLILRWVLVCESLSNTRSEKKDTESIFVSVLHLHFYSIEYNCLSILRINQDNY